MELGLEGKRVFISGSSRGIGLACAKVFLDEGATVVINGRNETTLKEVASSLGGEADSRLYFVKADILSNEGVSEVKQFIVDSIGGVDIFIANLGNGKPESENPLDINEWKRFYDINILTNLGMLDAIHDLLKSANTPSVTLISSVIAKEASQAPIGYAAAKSAVKVLSKYLSRLWADEGIRVNCVLPGNVYFQGGRWEELKEKDAEGVDEYINATVPMKRFGSPEEIADMVVFLSSERASFVTGAEICVDGGQSRSL